MALKAVTRKEPRNICESWPTSAGRASSPCCAGERLMSAITVTATGALFCAHMMIRATRSVARSCIQPALGPTAGAVIKAERARSKNVLVAHAGDFISPSLLSGFDHGEHMIALMNMSPVDIFVPGNHEFDFGKENYLKLTAAQTYPTFAANLRDAAGQPLPGHKDSQIFELGGFKVLPRHTWGHPIHRSAGA
eukprot:gene26002-33990_t